MTIGQAANVLEEREEKTGEGKREQKRREEKRRGEKEREKKGRVKAKKGMKLGNRRSDSRDDLKGGKKK